MRPMPFSLRSAVLGFALIGAMPAAHADDEKPRRTITISASGSVTVEPDQARITSGVTADAATAREALAKNSEAMAKVIAELKSAGIDPKDIQTASFRVEPRYTRPIEGQAPKIDGYSVTNEVQVLVRPEAMSVDVPAAPALSCRSLMRRLFWTCFTPETRSARSSA